MKHVCCIVTITLLVIVTELQACPEGWHYLAKSCYYKSGIAKTYSSALAFCHKFDATLVNINSEEENNLVYDNFVSKPRYRKTYIGVVRKESGSTTFVTSERKPQKYFNWGRGEPNNHGKHEDCVEMRRKYWNDIRCNTKLPFVCESKVGCQPNPCKNGGQCVILPEKNVGVYKCVCQDPFYGANCEHRFKGCAAGWVAFGHYCYRALPGERPWSIAETACIKAGGHLAAVQSEEENAFLSKNFAVKNFWVGITECLCGKKCTVDFSKVKYSNWDTCEPKDLDEAKGCALMVNDTGKWNNRDCNERHNTVCKRESTINIAQA